MSGETEADVSGWTTDTLRAHLLAMLAEKDRRDQQRFEAQTKAIDAAMAAAEKAVTKAENATERRFDAVNEFRATLSDQAATLASKAELGALVDRFVDLVARVDRTEGRSGGLNAGWGYLTGAIGLAVGVIAVVATLVGR